MSALFDVQDTLATALRTNAALSAIGVSVGYPRGGVGQSACWVSGECDDWTQEWDTSACSLKHEVFTLQVRIVVSVTTDSYSDARDALETLVEGAESALTTYYTLSDSVLMAQIARIELNEGYDEGSRRRQAGATIHVRCQTHHA